MRVGILLTLLSLPLCCSADSAVGYRQLCERFESARLAASSNSVALQGVLDTLKIIASGVASRLSADQASMLQIKRDPQELSGLAMPQVRGCAFTSIGRIPLPEAIQFLSGIKRDDFDPSSAHLMWPAAQIALYSARLSQTVGPYGAVSFFEDVLQEKHDAVANAPLKSWAIDELCDRGSIGSMALIRRAMSNWWGAERDEQELRFCEGRMRVINSSQDKVVALSSTLTVATAVSEPRLVLWAVGRLADIDDERARAALQKFSAELGRASQGSGSVALRDVEREIGAIRRRAKK